MNKILTTCRNRAFTLGLLLFSWSSMMAQSQGPNNPGTVAEENFACLSCPGSDWFNLNNTKVADGLYTTTHLMAYPTCFQSSCYISRALEASNFGFSIPLTASITGIQVDVKRTAWAANDIKDSTVLLMKNLVKIPGVNHANASFWPTTNTSVTYGGPGDLWGVSWRPGQIDSAGFGVYFKVTNRLNIADSASVDNIRVTVFYTASSGPPVAAFAASDTVFCQGYPVHFYDQSTGAITLWSWNFPGGNPDTSSQQNPVITYDSTGRFDVTLKVTDSAGSDSLTKYHLITVKPVPATPVITVSADTLTSTAASGNQWYLNGTLLPGDTGKQLVAPATGIYTVVVTNSSGCTAISAQKQVVITGFSQINGPAGGFHIFPNPSKGEFVIQFIAANNSSNATLRISDLSGKVVTVEHIAVTAGENRYPISLSDKMQAGLYFIELENGRDIFRQKLLIENAIER